MNTPSLYSRQPEWSPADFIDESRIEGLLAGGKNTTREQILSIIKRPLE